MISYEIESNIFFEMQQNNDLLLDIFYKILHLNDHHIVKQFIRIFMYLYFIDINKKKNTSDNIYIQLCKLKQYLYFKLYYIYNPFRENTPQIYDDENIMDSFMQNLEYATMPAVIFGQKTRSASTSKLMNKYLVSNVIYNKIFNLTTKNNFQRKQTQILEEYTNTNIIKQCIQDNNKLLKYIEKTNCFFIQPAITDVRENYNDILKRQIDTSVLLSKNVNVLKENTEKIQDIYNLMFETKQKENQLQLEKDYCRNTVLLNVDMLVQRLNVDVINIIQDFVGKDLLDNLRIHLIQTKYFKKPKKKIETMLSMWGNKRLKRFEKNTPYLRYKIDTTNIFNMPIYNYIQDDFLFYFYDEKIYGSFQKRKSEHILNRLLNTERVVDFYGFQRDVWILHHKVFKLSPV